jgi:DNA adenine methylase
MSLAHAARKLRPVIKTHGGKAYLARRIIALFPRHTTYVEPFAGGLSVLLNKTPAPVEVAGDVDRDLILAHIAVRDHCGELLRRLREIPYTRESFQWARTAGASADPVEAAVRFLVRNRMSRGGMGRDFAWSTRLRGGQPGDVNGWETALDQYPAIATRLQIVRLFCADWKTLIDEYDSPDALFYCDPPYPHAARTATDVYVHEMIDEAHEQLLERLLRVRGAVILSGYHNPLYDRLLASWTAVEFDMPNHSGQGRQKNRRVEVVYLNPTAVRGR